MGHVLQTDRRGCEFTGSAGTLIYICSDKSENKDIFQIEESWLVHELSIGILSLLIFV